MAGEVPSGSAPTRDPLDEAVRLHELAVAARDAGRLAEAEELATKSLHIFEAEAGPDNPVNPDVANVLLCLAGVHDDRADYVGAEPLYRRAADTVAKLPESDPGEVELQRLRMQAVGGLGTVLRILGRYGEAEPLLTRAVAIAERTFEGGDAEIADALNDLAVLYKYTGEFEKASNLYRRALTIVEQSKGADAPQAATILHNMGGLEHARGEFARGEPFARRSVSIREKTLGPDHPEVAADAAALAALLEGQEKFEEAEAIYRRALAIFERVYGPGH